ncbi:MAG: porin family protein [Ignavibacteriae bacterium]|nr:porin family protein [Ignavibacteriota bacterium]
MLCSLLCLTNALSQEQTEQQPERRIDLFFHAGTAFPSDPSDFPDYWDMGFAFGGGVGYSFSEAFSLSGSIDYSMFPLDEEEFLKILAAFGVPPDASISGGGISIFTVMANAKAVFNSTPNSVTPYVTTGIGFFNMSLGDITVTYQGQSGTGEVNEARSAFSFIIGAGVEIPLGAPTLFIEGKYCLGFTEGDNTGFIPIRAGVKIRI